MTENNFKFDKNIMELSYTGDLSQLHTEWIQLGYEERYDNSTRCICGHKIKNTYRYLNTKTAHMINVGSECVKKLRLNNCRNAKSIFRDFISGIPGEYECISDLIKYSVDNWKLFLQIVKDKVNTDWNNTNGLIELDKIIQILSLKNIDCEEIVQIMHNVSNEIKKREEKLELIRKNKEEFEKKRLVEENQLKKEFKEREKRLIEREEREKEANRREESKIRRGEEEKKRLDEEKRSKKSYIDMKKELCEKERIRLGSSFEQGAKQFLSKNSHELSHDTIRREVNRRVELIIDLNHPFLAEYQLSRLG